MQPRMRMIMGLAGIIGLVAIGLPGLWRHPESSNPGGLHEAMAGDDVIQGAVQEMFDKAKQYEQDADRHEAESQRYDQKADAITPLMDTKGFRRDALKIAADSHRTMAGELRFHAKTLRIEAELMMEKGKLATNEPR